ncbi:MAG: S8 family serine peptidase [Actinomycetota bacterium]
MSQLTNSGRQHLRRLVAVLTATLFLATGVAVAGASESSSCGVVSLESLGSEATLSMDQVVELIGAESLRADGLSGAGIDVALIDTGVEPVEGLDGDGKLYIGPDLSFESGLPEFYGRDTYGHGTAMASIIAGENGPNGFEGVAPGSRLVSLKVADNTGAVDVTQVIAAIDWVIEYGQEGDLNIRVINLSYATDSDQPYQIDPLAHAVERAWKAGIVVVVSAGNYGDDSGVLGNPASSPYVIAVAAADDSGAAPFSNSGSKERKPDLLAPGSRILGLAAPQSRLAQEHPDALIDGVFFRGSGTSQATAIISGAAALLLEQRPELTPDQVKALLLMGAVDDKNEGRAGEWKVFEDYAEQFDLLDKAEKYEAKACEHRAEAERLRAEGDDKKAEKEDKDAEKDQDKAEDARIEAERLIASPEERYLADAEEHLAKEAAYRAEAAALRQEAEALRAEGDDKDAKKADDEAEKLEEKADKEAEKAQKDLDKAEGAIAELEADIQDELSSWSGSSFGGIKFHDRSGFGMIDLERSAALPTPSITQHYPDSDGSGSLDAARGSSFVTLPDGSLLTGEVAFNGASWAGASWAGASWAGVSWAGSSWAGVSWAGASWAGVSWAGASWAGASWAGASWAGASWAGVSWAGASWAGVSWAGASWAGADFG